MQTRNHLLIRRSKHNNNKIIIIEILMLISAQPFQLQIVIGTLQCNFTYTLKLLKPSHVSRTKFTACAMNYPKPMSLGKRKSYRREHEGMLALGDETPSRVSILHLSLTLVSVSRASHLSKLVYREAANESRLISSATHSFCHRARNTDGITQKRFNFVVK